MTRFKPFKLAGGDAVNIHAILDEMEEDEPKLFQLLRPVPEDVADHRHETMEWRKFHWGSYCDIRGADGTPPHCDQRSSNYVVLKFWTPATPPLELYKFMVVDLGFSVMATFDIDDDDPLCGSWHDGDLHMHNYKKFMEPVNQLKMTDPFCMDPYWAGRRSE
jgi:hypothetical protein